VTVTRATANGTTNPATAGTDYVALAAAPISFAPGITSQTVTVVVNGDTLSEANETLFLNLSAPVNAVILDGQGIGTIVNDDAACTTAPNAPSNLTGTVTGFTVTINWSAPVGGCAPTSYRIQGGPTPGSTASTLNTGNTLTTRTTTSPAGTFYFRVSAVNAFGVSGPSNELTVVVPQP
jgi:hypothetical protein